MNSASYQYKVILDCERIGFEDKVDVWGLYLITVKVLKKTEDIYTHPQRLYCLL